MANTISLIIKKITNFAKSIFGCFLGLIFYRFALDYSYVNIISPLYEYQGFFSESSNDHYNASWLFLILLSPLIIKTLLSSNISSNIMSTLVLISLVPTSSLFALVIINLNLFT